VNTTPDTATNRLTAGIPESSSGRPSGTQRRGLAVLPLGPGSKKPAVDDWPHAATTDPTQITRWWTQAPGCATAVGRARPR
jgi:hypothetical protein